MVDCDFFTEFNRQLIVEPSRVILDYKNCDYSLQFTFPYQNCSRIAKAGNSNNFLKKIPIKAVYGIIEMQVNSYLAVVTKASVIGQIYHRKIFQVQRMEFICLAGKQAKQDKSYVAGLEALFASKYWFFSDDYDLTNSLQQFISSNNSMKNKRIQYMYNSDWIDDFLKVKAYEWITGFISGYISISFTHAGPNSSCQLALITRRDKRRQGKRWLTRGADLDGNTANTAQTEMVFWTESGGKQYIFSHVQLRGSIPGVWKQTPNLQWQPKLVIHPNDKLNCDLTKKNYEDIKVSYQNCLLVNLIDKKKNQKRIGQYFERMHNNINDEAMRFVWFDFHAECKKMKYENLSKLLDQVTGQLENYGYFHIEMTSGTGERASKKNTQKGIIRTNCMDCLDRTNVVQSVFARQLLLSWLAKLGMMSKSRGLSAFQKLPDSLEQIFRGQWTKNADVVSLLYSGTPAAKTDFTATGKRTTKGALKDGYYSIKRYFLGNFFDSRDQDYIDFSLSKIKPKKSKAEQIHHSACNTLYILILFIVIAFIVIGNQVDSFLPDSAITFHYKIIVGLVTILTTIFIARQLRSVILRQPIRKEGSL